MKKIYFILLALLCISQAVHAQSISINYANETCIGSVQQISVNITGEFKPDNQFTVEVRQTDGSKTFAAVPAFYKNGYIQVTHTDTLLGGYYNLQLRILASSPKTESNWSSLRIYRKGYVDLSLSESDTINSGDDLKIKYTTYSNSSVYVTLNDSTRHSVYNYDNGSYTSYFSVPAFNSNPVYIVHAENSCGAMSVSGQIKPVINPVSLRTVSVAPAAVCEDGEIKVSFSTQGPAFSAQTKYRLRFIEASAYDQKVRQAEVVATLKDNVLIARIPSNFNLKDRTQFKIQILTSNPAVTGASDGIIVDIYPKAKVEFASSSKTIRIGQTASGTLNFRGLPPFWAELQDGTLITSYYSELSAYYSVKPEKTTSYKIKSFTSGCGQITDPSPQTLVVTVNQGLFIETEGVIQPFCAGSVVRIPIMSNLNLSASTIYFVRARYNDTNQTEISFPAKKVDNFLEFTIPESPENENGLTYDEVYGFYVGTSNPAATSNFSSKYVIQTTPDLVVTNTTLSYSAPGAVSLHFSVKGKGPITIEDMDGKKYQSIDTFWYGGFYLKETTDYKIRSISNACFANNNVKPVRVTLNTANAPTRVYIEPVITPVCYSDSIEITFRTTGSFNKGNLFNIQGCTGCSTLPTVATVPEPGKYKIKIPVGDYDGASHVSFRIASTNPVFFSEQIYVELNRPPANLYLNPTRTASTPAVYLKGEEIYLSLTHNGGSATSFMYSDGGPDKVSQFDQELISPPVGVTTSYTIKSVTNSCGSTVANLTTYIKVIPYRITLSESNNSVACVGQPLTIPFNIARGNPGNATFSLQIAKTNSSDFITLVENETSRTLNTIIPASLTEGSYQLRVVSSDGSASDPRSIQIGTLPTVALTSDLPEPVMISPCSSMNLKLSLTGMAPWTIISSDNTRQTIYSSPSSYYIYPKKGQDYSINTVYNSCGYGTASGKVSVKVKPTLITSADNGSVCQGGTFNVRYELQGDAGLTSDYIRFELIDTVSQKVIVLDSTKTLSGQKLLKIPDILSGSSYQIRCTLKSYNINSLIFVTVATKADLTLIGSTSIIAGESAQLLIRSNKIPNNTDQINYKLSDGTAGTFRSYYNQMYYNVNVKPSQTTTYTIASANNSCGNAIITGSATIEVNPLQERSVTVTDFANNNVLSRCLGDTISVYYETKGTFSAENQMTVQISDSTGKNFKSVKTIGNTSPLKAVIPTDLFAEKIYRVRIIASDANTSSGAYYFPVIFVQKAKARFASESVLYDGVSNPKIVVLLEGGGPWYYQYGTDFTNLTRSTSNASDTITLFQASPNQYYKLFRVQNSCGVGTIGTPAAVRVEVITAEPAAFTSKIIVAPNPTQDFLLLKFETALPRNAVLFNKQGIPVEVKQLRSLEENFDVRNIPTGMYILQIETKGKKESFKVIKH